MTRCLIVGASPALGSAEVVASLVPWADIVIAADAAGEWLLDNGIRPDVVVGDFDSARPGAVERLEAAHVPTTKAPIAKDASDLDLCVDHARRRGADEIVFTACLGGRLDHTLANLGALARCADLRARLVEPSLTIHALEGTHRPGVRLRVAPGTPVACVAVTPCDGVVLEGLRYPLSGARLEPLSSLGISNEAVADIVTIRVRTGTLLVMTTGPASVSTPGAL